MKDIRTSTLAALVTENSRMVPLLEKYNLDFCCQGKRTLSDACSAKGLSIEKIVSEWEKEKQLLQNDNLNLDQQSCADIIGYLLLHHHFYVKQSMPVIAGHLEKIVNKHGIRFPYMVLVEKLFKEVREEMFAHMQKEEIALFPRIKALEQRMGNLDGKNMTIPAVSIPIQLMEQEHEQVGNLLHEIRVLTGQYKVPEGTCTTFSVVMDELKEFEEDLHKHVHLENYVLFPKAIQIEKAFSN